MERKAKKNVKLYHHQVFKKHIKFTLFAKSQLFFCAVYGNSKTTIFAILAKILQSQNPLCIN